MAVNLNTKEHFQWYLGDEKTLRCQAWKKGRVEQCSNPAVEGFTVCRVHGAGSKGKPGGRPISHGRFSKKLPENLINEFREAMADPTMLELRSEISLITARLEELTATLSDNSVHLRKIVIGVNALEQALESENPNALTQAVKLIKNSVNSASSLDYTWAKITNLIHDRRLLVESERKRLIENRQVLTTEQLFILMSQLQTIILGNVTDPRARAKIVNELKKLLGGSKALEPEIEA